VTSNETEHEEENGTEHEENGTEHEEETESGDD
jgi:hypothetical protein